MASCPITSWQIQGEKVEAVTDCIFFSSKITADSNFIYEIKKCLLFERKDMTKLDSILKSRDISLLKKVLTVKVVVFLIIKKTEHWRTDAFKSVVQKDSWESLELQGDQTSQSQKKSTLIIHWKDMLKLKLQYFGHLMWRVNSLEKTMRLGKIEDKRRVWQRMRWLDRITNALDMKSSNLQDMVEHRGAWCAAVLWVSKRHDLASEQQQYYIIELVC